MLSLQFIPKMFSRWSILSEHKLGDWQPHKQQQKENEWMEYKHTTTTFLN